MRHALDYGPAFFGIVGAWNAVGMVVGTQALDGRLLTLSASLTVLPLLFAAPFVAFFLRRKAAIERRRSAYPEGA